MPQAQTCLTCRHIRNEIEYVSCAKSAQPYVKLFTPQAERWIEHATVCLSFAPNQQSDEDLFEQYRDAEGNIDLYEAFQHNWPMQWQKCPGLVLSRLSKLARPIKSRQVATAILEMLAIVVELTQKA